MTRYQVGQITTYTYQGTARQSISQFKLKPLHDPDQRLISYRLTVDPPAPIYEHRDYFGNHTATVYHWDPHPALTIRTESVVELSRMPVSRDRVLKERSPSSLAEAAERHAEFVRPTVYTSAAPGLLDRLSQPLWEKAETPWDYAMGLTGYIYDTFFYVKGETTVETTADEFIQTQKGVCQDFAHLMLALLRYRGIPARYVSGYIDSGHDSAVRGDAATHAWVEVLMAQNMWAGFDPTNNQVVGSQYIRVAVGRDYRDIVPTRGVYTGGGQSLSVQVSVQHLA